MRMDSVGSLWEKAWKSYAERFSVAMSILLPPLLLLGLGNIFQAMAFPPSLAAAGSILSFVGAVLSVIGTGALIYALQHKVDFAEAYHAGWHLFWPLLWVTILVCFTMFGAGAMLVIPGVWIVMMLIFANYILVIENKKGMPALLQSYAYVKGYWWAVFGRVVLLLLALIAAYVVVDIPFSLVGGHIGTAIGSAIVLLFFAPFSVVYYFSMYQNFVALKPHVRDGAPTEGKTFMVVAQIVCIIILIFIIAGLIASAVGGWSNTAASGPMPPGSYGGY